MAIEAASEPPWEVDAWADDPMAPSSWRPDDWTPPIPDAIDLVVEAAGLVSVMTAQQYQRVEAMRRESLADAARHGFELTEVIERSMRLELAAALAITEAAAGNLIREADALVNRYPSALDSLSGGRITPRHAAELVHALDALEPPFRERVGSRALALAEAHAVGAFRRHLRAMIETVRATTSSERHERAVDGRRAYVQPVADGMADLMLRMPEVEARAIFGRATAIAKVLAKRDGEQRSLDQLRLDVLADLLIDGDTSLVPTEARGIRATVAVTVPALALLATSDDSTEIATVEGIGPIPMQRARELCGGAGEWMRVLTHPETGVVLSVGRDSYRPPASLRRLVRWRAETCMAPGCSIPASRCEIDHTIAWEDGGSTSLENLAPLCKGHHTVKHHGRWCVEQIPGSGGALVWISPSGRRYRTEPERRVPAFRAETDSSPPPF